MRCKKTFPSKNLRILNKLLGFLKAKQRWERGSMRLRTSGYKSRPHPCCIPGLIRSPGSFWQRGQTPADAGGTSEPPGINNTGMIYPDWFARPGTFWQCGQAWLLQRTKELPVMRKHRELRSVLVRRRALVEVVKWGRTSGYKPHRGAHSRIPATDDDSQTAILGGYLGGWWTRADAGIKNLRVHSDIFISGFYRWSFVFFLFYFPSFQLAFLTSLLPSFWWFVCLFVFTSTRCCWGEAGNSGIPSAVAMLLFPAWI